MISIISTFYLVLSFFSFFFFQVVNATIDEEIEAIENDIEVDDDPEPTVDVLAGTIDDERR